MRVGAADWVLPVSNRPCPLATRVADRCLGAGVARCNHKDRQGRIASRGMASHHITSSTRRAMETASVALHLIVFLPTRRFHWLRQSGALAPSPCHRPIPPSTVLARPLKPQGRKERLPIVMRPQPSCALDIMCVFVTRTAPTSVAALHHANVDMPSSSPARKLLPYSR